MGKSPGPTAAGQSPSLADRVEALGFDVLPGDGDAYEEAAVREVVRPARQKVALCDLTVALSFTAYAMSWPIHWAGSFLLAVEMVAIAMIAYRARGQALPDATVKLVYWELHNISRPDPGMPFLAGVAAARNFELPLGMYLRLDTFHRGRGSYDRILWLCDGREQVPVAAWYVLEFFGPNYIGPIELRPARGVTARRASAIAGAFLGMSTPADQVKNPFIG